MQSLGYISELPTQIELWEIRSIYTGHAHYRFSGFWRALACTDLCCRDLVSVCQLVAAIGQLPQLAAVNNNNSNRIAKQGGAHSKVDSAARAGRARRDRANVWPYPQCSVAISQAFLMGWHWLVALILIRCCTLHKIVDLEGICCSCCSCCSCCCSCSCCSCCCCCV